MADAPVTAPVSNSADQSAKTVEAPTTVDAPLKEPEPETQGGKAAEPLASEVTQPLAVVPEPSKPAITPAADTNGATSGVNGTGENIQPLAPEVSKQSSVPAVDSVANETSAPNNAPTTSKATEVPAESAQPAVMTGALPLNEQSSQGHESVAPSDSIQDDGVKDVPATATNTAELGTSGTDKKDRGEEGASSTEIAPGAAAADKKDVDMKDVAAVEPESSSEQKDVDMKDAVPAPATAPVADGTGASSASGAGLATNGEEATGEKRKAEAGANGTATSEGPAEKKHKGLAGKVATKAKEVVEEVKEKATPARKNSKKGKKEQAPVGRTERKTRSQGRLE